MRCIIQTEGIGDMVFELYPDAAPLTVKNFCNTAKRGFYDGLLWCRIVKDYVIQSGSPDNDIMTDSDWHIKGEFYENGIENPIRHQRGAISMARDDGYDTAGTQFFVVYKDALTDATRLSDRCFRDLMCLIRLQKQRHLVLKRGISR